MHNINIQYCKYCMFIGCIKCRQNDVYTKTKQRFIGKVLSYEL